MKLGLLGGSFNPVHLGHLFLADKAITILKLDRIVMIPAYRSPFKLSAEGVERGAKDRIDMLAAAIAADSRLAIDDCEIRREGISYTVDTLEDIISRFLPPAENPTGSSDDVSQKLSLIIGDDIAPDFPKWKDSEKILRLADIVIARRTNSSVDYPFAHTFLDNEVMNISSQDIRRKIKEGTDWKSLVPAEVRAIIEDRRLYGYNGVTGTDEDCSYKVILQIEKEARETLSTERFLHSRNTALLAQDLCLRFGLDPAAGYLAGIAHDLAKQIDNKILLKLAKSDGMEITALERERPNLLHGRAAAVLLRERFCIHNEDVLEAVAVHTSGKENMGDLAKVIYIADKAEFSRNIDPAHRRMCYEEDLDAILYAMVKKTISKLQSKKLDLSGDTMRLFSKLKEKNS